MFERLFCKESLINEVWTKQEPNKNQTRIKQEPNIEQEDGEMRRKGDGEKRR